MKEIFLKIRQYTQKKNWYLPWISPAAVAVCALYAFLLLQHKDGFLLSALILLGGICVLCSRKKIYTLVYLILLMILTLIERHFITHYNVSFRESGSQALITLNITDVEEILSYITLLKWTEFLNAIFFLAVISLQFIPEFNIPEHPASGFSWKSHLSGILSIFWLLTFAGCIAYSPVHNYFHDWYAQKSMLLQRKNFTFQAKDLEPNTPAVHFLVIGESHRKDEFDSIVLNGGSRILTQAKANGSLFEFEDMISHYQQTWYSVFTLLCRRGADDMSTNFHEKGLFAFFQEAGWKVYYVTYQPKSLSYTGYDCVVNEANVYINAREETGNNKDTSFSSVIDRILKKKEKKVLIVIKMVGCHFHYSDRYPQTAQYRKYMPAYTKGKSAKYKIEDKQLLINTYRNAMSFSAGVLDDLAKRCRDLKVPSFFFFLSDHGIINYDDGKNPFFGAARSNFHIPCIFYCNELYKKHLSESQTEILKRNGKLPAGNEYVFDTIVSLAGLTYPAYRKEMDLSSGDMRPAKDRKVWIWKKKIPYDSLPPK